MTISISLKAEMICDESKALILMQKLLLMLSYLSEYRSSPFIDIKIFSVTQELIILFSLEARKTEPSAQSLSPIL